MSITTKQTSTPMKRFAKATVPCFALAALSLPAAEVQAHELATQYLTGTEGHDQLASIQEEALIGEIANLLQASSYDGAPVTMDKSVFRPGSSADGNKVVKDIMHYTGLPQNFKVFPGDVPNAAAIIILDNNNIPHRIIAYNTEFMKEVNIATQNNNWAPVSIMAHEIGHHLSGHTLAQGGSQPPTELEADKFSGFVLYKMGATLDDAKKALETLIPEQGSATHPGRAKRIAAVTDGWQQSCLQQGNNNCDGDAASPKKLDIASKEPAAATTSTETFNILSVSEKVTLPTPGHQITPAKFDRFIIDEAGLFDNAAKTAFAEKLYQFAADNSVEIVVLAPASLHGKSADEYAYEMMRQLRVGKLEVGNGVVLVMAPTEGEVGIALGGGVYTEMMSKVDSLKRSMASYLKQYKEAMGRSADMERFKKSWASNAFGAADHIMRDTKAWEWFVRYQSLDEAVTAKSQYDAELKSSGARYEPFEDPTWRKLIREKGTLVSKSPSVEDKDLKINSSVAERLQPMHFRTNDGKNLIVYFNDRIEAQMPVKLEQGKTYELVVRERSITPHDNNYQLDAVSYAQDGF